MSDLISRQAAIDAIDIFVKVDEENCTEYDIGYNDGIDFAISSLSVLPSAQPNLEKPDRSCKTCHYVDEFLGGVFLCRRLKESKRVQPDFWCKKWRGEQDE